MLEIQNLSAFYGKKQVLSELSFSLTPHRLTAVLGRNGSGKSTLVSCINQTVPYTGKILFSGQSTSLMMPRERAKYIAVLPQLLLSPKITVEELVFYGRSPYLDIGKRFSQSDRSAVSAAVEEVGVFPLLQKYVCDISGGERQRAFLAMILAQDTRVIVLDEPTTYMDSSYETSFMQTLSMLKTQRKKTLMVIMHNLTQAVKYADNIVVLEEGKLLFCGTKAECLCRKIIEKTFGVKRYEAEGEIFFL